MRRSAARAARRRAGAGLLALLAASACDGGESPAAAGGSDGAHVVSIVLRGGQQIVEPSQLRIRTGERVRFHLQSPHPESLAFDTSAASPAARAFFRKTGIDRRPLLTEPGQTYEVSFEGAPPGTYSYLSIPRGAAGMRGEIVVE